VLALSVLKGYTTLPEPGLMAVREKAGVDMAARILARYLEFDGSAPWGRYGKPSESIMARLRELQNTVSFPLDYVYTGKALLQLEQMAMAGRFIRGSRLLFLHTGGYQTAPIPFTSSFRKPSPPARG
jgi:1-aminocyclopropane-1-carboxylate deaminase